MTHTTRETVNVGTIPHAVYSEAEVEQAREDAQRGVKVVIRRYCGECNAALYGTNLEVMEKPPVCETH